MSTECSCKAHLPAGSSDHITDALVCLHWLRIPERIEIADRSADLQSHEWYGTAISGTIACVADLPGRRALRSVVTNRLTVPAVKLSTIGSRAFSVSRKKSPLRHLYLQCTFQRHIKTFLFRKSFPDIIAD